MDNFYEASPEKKLGCIKMKAKVPLPDQNVINKFFIVTIFRLNVYSFVQKSTII